MHQRASSSIKPASRSIGIDDGPFPPKIGVKIRYAPLLAVWLNGSHLEKLRTDWIQVDGLDATRKARSLLKGALSIPVFLSGVTFGGFNIIDPRSLQEMCRAPVIVVISVRPDNNAVKRALSRHFPDWKERWDRIRSLGPLHKLRTRPREPLIFFEHFGCSTREAESILKSWAFISRVPEPLRVAGIAARGLFSSEPSG
ncbi:MAG TPA: DUF99 family protein [Candidatus Bathyarchaeia archaeon]|nr:DUF99 family protein [Candidatus Bathyarchaeia archaeon]